MCNLHGYNIVFSCLEFERLHLPVSMYIEVLKIAIRDFVMLLCDSMHPSKGSRCGYGQRALRDVMQSRHTVAGNQTRSICTLLNAS